MTTAEQLARDLATDLRLDPASRHALVTAAQRLAALQDDAQVRAEAGALAERHRDRTTLAGALLALSAGIIEERLCASLDPVARAAHEDAMPGTGTMGGAADSGAVQADVAEALARAADLEATGNRAAAEAIRRTIATYSGEG